MRLRTILSLATFFLACFTVAIWSQPLEAKPEGRNADAGAANRSISGTISSVNGGTFAIDIMKDNQPQKTVEFQMDDNTKVEGELMVGSLATVEYHPASGKNVAVHVVVTQSSGVTQ
jgi:hypothetical protein